MSELHKFIFDGLPVRGAIVRLTDSWQEILQRRAGNKDTGAYPEAVSTLLGEMTAAGVLMQSNIKFNGALVFQVMGDGPVKLAVAEVQSDLSLRATASLVGEASLPLRGQLAPLAELVNAHGAGRCAVTLDPKDRQPGQNPYQGVVPLNDGAGGRFERLSDALQFYMMQSEQLDTVMVLAANDQIAAGLMLQRMPVKGEANLAAATESGEAEHDAQGLNEEYNRIATLASSLTQQELLTLDVETILRRLFWEEKLLRFAPQADEQAPRFACTCSRDRVAAMLTSLGEEEVDSIVAERGKIEVGCDFCGQQYQFDAIDAARLFTEVQKQPPSSSSVQ
ncbi:MULTISPECIES: Hsp33 family molecular chaperone HslO [Comamonas]|uniref:Hsp33 family molecular chaperone HslO n=1 Tax=Comamonas TaxID=283 RepID=UPI0001BB0E48|nr:MULTISPECIES: Hsp33 family molecular chaperone HslO [Comamonas]MBL5976685.1 Hsp33 family molecular chaperone HslO [Comamonas sp. NyZ500]ACY31871.1 Hsp33 protein [Comamonas thiooxydans]EFI62263.1 Hsp33 protein [Comamonas thiooxydans]KKI14302.1 Hsp33 chaperonin [Comamonas thiooxydans]MDH1254257.1 Hsp33 family molecular chaperone HslO [Comamonas thiooxydans]